MDIICNGLSFLMICLGIAVALGGPISLIIIAVKHKPCKHNWERIAQLNKKIESNYRPHVFLEQGAVIVYRCKNCGKIKKVDLSE